MPETPPDQNLRQNRNNRHSRQSDIEQGGIRGPNAAIARGARLSER